MPRIPRICPICFAPFTTVAHAPKTYCSLRCRYLDIPKKTPEERFWQKVDKNGPIPPHAPHLGQCWIWAGYLHPSGYGYMGFTTKRDGKITNIKTHRFSYILHFGEIPDGHFICHKCDTPACVNPSHLFSGTQLDNIKDRTIKQRGSFQGARHPNYTHPENNRGEKHPQSILTESQCLEIIKRSRNGEIGNRLAKEFGVSRGYVYALLKGRTWKYLDRS